MFIMYHFWGQTIYTNIYMTTFSNSVFSILLDEVELFFSVFFYPMKVKVLVAQLCLTLCDPMAVAHQDPLSM